MTDEAERFRKRANDCRRLAGDARDEGARRTLSEMAVELDAEADRVDQEEATGPEEA